MNSTIKESYWFLYENAKPIIKHEAAMALNMQSNELRAEMLNCPDVQYWICRLEQFAEKRQVHNADDHCLENSMYKLASFGVQETDDIRIKKTNDFILDYLYANQNNIIFIDSINNTIMASWLSYMGREEAIVNDILLERINAVYSFTKEKIYDIYISPDGYPAIPASRKRHPFVNPALYENNVWKLPTVHDLFAYFHLPRKLSEDREIQEKINTILDYILDDRYQRLNLGYGLMLFPPNKYYSMGWSVHLYGYFKDSPLGLGGVVWNMEMMSHFSNARQSQWFNKMLQHLNSFSNNEIYQLPKEYLSESHKKYYIGGGHMGLGEDRKQKSWRKIESTAWMLRILRNCE